MKIKSFDLWNIYIVYCYTKLCMLEMIYLSSQYVSIFLIKQYYHIHYAMHQQYINNINVKITYPLQLVVEWIFLIFLSHLLWIYNVAGFIRTQITFKFDHISYAQSNRDIFIKTKAIMQGKLFQRCTHLSYCSVLSLCGNLNTRRMSQPDMGSIFHIKNHWYILVIGNYYVNYQNYQI